MLPAVIVDMLGIVIAAVAVVVLSVIQFFSNFLAGFISLLVGILVVGKKHAWYTHTYIHNTYVHTYRVRKKNVYEVCPENSRIYPVKIFSSYLEAIQPCRLQSTPLYSVCTAASVSSIF